MEDVIDDTSILGRAISGSFFAAFVSRERNLLSEHYAIVSSCENDFLLYEMTLEDFFLVTNLFHR